MASLKLKKFNIASISDDSVVVFIGRRRTGKSFLVKDLLYHHRDIPIGTIVSGTEIASPYYCHIIPSIFIHSDMSPMLIQQVICRQRKLKRKMEKECLKNVDSRALLLLDDCLYDKTWINDVNIRNIFMNGRHYNILLLITLQYPLGVPPNLRTNIDYTFILRDNNINNRKRIYENYASMFPTFDLFCTVMDQCTENYECLVIKNDTSTNKLQDQVFWYKATPHKDFKMFPKEFWDAAEEAERKRAEEEDCDDNMLDISQLSKKKTPKVNVIKS